MANVTVTCSKCNKQFLIVEQEQKFLQARDFPFPTQCPQCRQQRRLVLRGGRQLYKTKCQKCSKDIVVSYDPQQTKQTIYCREDYQKFFEENDPIIKDPLP